MKHGVVPGRKAGVGKVDVYWKYRRSRYPRSRTRRAARLAFIVPSLEVGVDATKYSSPFFNPGTGLPGTSAVTTHVAASYEILSARKIADLAATDAGHEAAAAGELAQRFQTAMATEADYYDVLANQELLRVATERLNPYSSAIGVVSMIDPVLVTRTTYGSSEPEAPRE